jgi:hypothetical protein
MWYNSLYLDGIVIIYADTYFCILGQYIFTLPAIAYWWIVGQLFLWISRRNLFLDTSSWQPTFNLVISNSICVCFLSCKHYTDLHERRSMHSRRIVPTLISCYTALWPWPGDRKINRSLSFHGHNHYTNLHDRLSNHYRDIVLNNVKLLSWRFISFQCLSYRRYITKITQI